MDRRELLKGTAVIAGAALLPKVAVADEVSTLGFDQATGQDQMVIAVYDLPDSVQYQLDIQDGLITAIRETTFFPRELITTAHQH